MARVTEFVMVAAARAVAELSAGETRFAAISQAAGVSDKTMRRAFAWLAEIGAPIVFVPDYGQQCIGRWRLTDRSWRIPPIHVTTTGLAPSIEVQP